MMFFFFIPYFSEKFSKGTMPTWPFNECLLIENPLDFWAFSKKP